MLDRRVPRTALVGLKARDRSDVDDVPHLRFAQQRQARARHEHQAEDVDVPHPRPVLVLRLFQRFEAQRAACVVDQDVDTAKPFADFANEAVHAFPFSDVQLESKPCRPDRSLHAVDPACAADHCVSALRKSSRARGPDS